MNTASTPKPPRAPGFWWALAGFGLGSLVSVGFNLQYAWLGARDHAPDWAPSLASQAAAVVWPLALIVSVEVLTRIAWPRALGWKAVQIIGILAVAGGSGVISYGHIHGVLRAWGYKEHQAIVGPLVVDGLMLISGFALVALGRAARAAASTAQEILATRPIASSRTSDAPARPDPSVGQEHAVSVTQEIPDPVTETAPQEASQLRLEEASQEVRAGLRLVPSRRLPSNPRTASRKASPKSSRRGACSDQEVLDAIASYEQEENKLPTANWLKTNLSGVGASRAKDLLEKYTEKQEVTA